VGHNRAEVEADLRNQFKWIAFTGDESAAGNADALADSLISDEAISEKAAQELGDKVGIDVAREKASNGFNSASDTLYGGVMAFQNWQETPSGDIPLPNSRVPYIGCKRAGAGASVQQNGLNIGRLRVTNGLAFSVDVRLYHPQAPKVPFATWHVGLSQTFFLATNGQPINIGSDWRLQVIYGPTTSAIFLVGNVATYNAMVFDVNAAFVPALSIGRIRLRNDYAGTVTIRLYHPQSPNQIFATWFFQSQEQSFLALNSQLITIGSDWGIQVVFGNGVTSAIRNVGSIALFADAVLDVLATEVYEG
jgi:hypothetical protein